MDADKEQPYQVAAKHKSSREPGRRQKKRGGFLKGLLLLLFVLGAWAGLVYLGYDYATRHLKETEQFFAGQLAGLRQSNAELEKKIAATLQGFQSELARTHAEMEQLRGELQLIQEELALTGETITGTDQTRLSLQERMAELDRQLAALREQLKKLEDAVRAF